MQSLNLSIQKKKNLNTVIHWHSVHLVKTCKHEHPYVTCIKGKQWKQGDKKRHSQRWSPWALLSISINTVHSSPIPNSCDWWLLDTGVGGEGADPPPSFPSLSQGENEMRVPIATSAAELFCEGDPRSGGVYNKLGLDRVDRVIGVKATFSVANLVSLSLWLSESESGSSTRERWGVGGCLREEDLSFSGSGLQNDTLLRADRLLSDFSVDLADFPPELRTGDLDAASLK